MTKLLILLLAMGSFSISASKLKNSTSLSDIKIGSQVLVNKTIHAEMVYNNGNYETPIWNWLDLGIFSAKVCKVTGDDIVSNSILEVVSTSKNTISLEGLSILGEEVSVNIDCVKEDLGSLLYNIGSRKLAFYSNDHFDYDQYSDHVQNTKKTVVDEFIKK